MLHPALPLILMVQGEWLATRSQVCTIQPALHRLWHGAGRPDANSIADSDSLAPCHHQSRMNSITKVAVQLNCFAPSPVPSRES